MTDYTELKRLVDRVLTDRRFCGDENHKALADGVLVLIAESERLAAACEKAEQIINAESKAAAIASGCANLLQTERDQLKVENQRLEADHDLLMSNALPREFIKLRADYDQLRAELAGLRTGFDAQNEAIARLKKECKGAELYRQVERGAYELPEDWEVQICIEKDSGYVELFDRDGCEVDFPNSCETLWLTVSEAIDAAMGKGGEV